MDAITSATRRESYTHIKGKRDNRQNMILNVLGNRQMTASEITEELLSKNQIRFYSRNFVAPRLTELKKAGKVRTCGCRICTMTGKSEAVWEQVEAGR